MTTVDKKAKKHKLLKAAVATVATAGVIAGAGMTYAHIKNANAASLKGVNKIELADSYKGFKIQYPLDKFPIYGSVKGEPLYHEDFTTNNNFQAWCTNYNQATPNAGSETTSKKAASDLQFHVLLNGYPLKSPSELGVDSKLEAIGATQIAVWVASGDFTENEVDFSHAHGTGDQVTSQAARNRVKAAVHKILSEARKDKRGQGQPELNFDKVGTLKVNSDGSTTSYYKLSVTDNYDDDLKSIKMSSAQVPKGSKITQDGKEINVNDNVNLKSLIKVETPAPTENSDNSSKQIKLTFRSYIKTWTDASYYQTKNNGEKRQDVLVQSTVDPGTFYTDAEDGNDVPDTLGSVSVHKVDNHNKPLDNVKFDLLDENKKVIKQGVTDKDGNLTFDKLPPAKYYVREADTDSEHEVDHAMHDVSFTGQDAVNKNLPKVTVTNDSINDNPYITSSATENDTGSRYIDAKDTSLQDELELHQLDGTHKYKVVDTLMDTKTGEPAKIDGKPVTASQEFTADGKSGEHTNQKLTMKFDKANFKGLQGNRYAFQAKIYRSSGDEDGKLLATEFSLNDTNQSIIVNKPTITTKVRSAIKKNSTTDTQLINPYTKSSWIDNVTANNLVKDHDYSAHLKMMVKNGDGSVSELKVNGKAVTADKDFTADNSQMNFDVDFGNVDTTSLKGKALVVYADITAKGDNDNALATHNDANDTNETLQVTNPTMQTHALLDNDSISNPSHTSRLLDRVTYSGVAENQPVTLNAILSDKDKKAIVASSSNGDNANKEYDYLMGKVTFTPTSDNGTTDVPLQKVKAGSSDKDQDITKLAKDIDSASVRNSMNTLQSTNLDKGTPDTSSKDFQIDTTGLKGKSMVVFEDMSFGDDNTPVISHADVNDKDQTISVADMKIGTQALVNSKKVSNPSTTSKISDKVKYEGAAPGHPLDISALATNQSDGTPVTIKKNGKTYNLMGKIRIIPGTASGTAIVPLQMVEVKDTNTNTTTQDSSKSDVTKDLTSEGSALERIKNNPIQVTDPRTDSDANTDTDSDKYNIDTTSLRGKTITMFEDVTSPADNNSTAIVTEANLKNTDQSIRTTSPSIQTMQTANDQKTIYSDAKDPKLVDKVQYKDFAPNEKVTLNAVDMDKGTKELAMINNQYVVGRTTFTPKSANGTVKVYMNAKKEQPLAMYTVKQLQANGLPTDNASTTEQAHSTKTADQLLNMNNGSISDNSDVNSKSDGQTDTNDKNTVETNRNGDNSYESQSDSSVGTENADSNKDTSESGIDLSFLDRLAANAKDPTNREFKWTAFETAQGDNGSVITEHKDISSNDQTVTIKVPKNAKTPKKETPKKQDNTPKLAQTGSSDKYSKNPILNFFERLF